MQEARVILSALGGQKEIHQEEQPTIDFAYACVVTTQDIQAGDIFDASNTWVKRPGTGEIKAKDYENVLGRRATQNLRVNAQVDWSHVA